MTYFSQQQLTKALFCMHVTAAPAADTLALVPT